MLLINSLFFGTQIYQLLGRFFCNALKTYADFRHEIECKSYRCFERYHVPERLVESQFSSRASTLYILSSSWKLPLASGVADGMCGIPTLLLQMTFSTWCLESLWVQSLDCVRTKFDQYNFLHKLSYSTLSPRPLDTTWSTVLELGRARDKYAPAPSLLHRK